MTFIQGFSNAYIKTEKAYKAASVLTSIVVFVSILCLKSYLFSMVTIYLSGCLEISIPVFCLNKISITQFILNNKLNFCKLNLVQIRFNNLFACFLSTTSIKINLNKYLYASGYLVCTNNMPELLPLPSGSGNGSGGCENRGPDDQQPIITDPDDNEDYTNCNNSLSTNISTILNNDYYYGPHYLPSLTNYLDEYLSTNPIGSDYVINRDRHTWNRVWLCQRILRFNETRISETGIKAYKLLVNFASLGGQHNAENISPANHFRSKLVLMEDKELTLVLDRLKYVDPISARHGLRLLHEVHALEKHMISNNTNFFNLYNDNNLDPSP